MSNKVLFEIKTVEDQERFFIADLMDFLEKNDPDHSINPQWLVQEFVNHWCQPCANDKDILWERERMRKLRKGIKASIPGALKTWRNNSKSWHPNKWKKNRPEETYKPRQSKEGQIAGFERLYNNEKFNLNR